MPTEHRCPKCNDLLDDKFKFKSCLNCGADISGVIPPPVDLPFTIEPLEKKKSISESIWNGFMHVCTFVGFWVIVLFVCGGIYGTFFQQPVAICNDRTKSYSSHRIGTCSNHLGVLMWTNEGLKLPKDASEDEDDGNFYYPDSGH